MLQVESIFWKIQWNYVCSPAAVHDKIMEQIKDVDSLKTQEISVYWVGMAEVNFCWLVIWGTKVIFAAIYKLFSASHYIVMCLLLSPWPLSLVLTSMLIMFPHQNVQIMGSFDGWSQGEAMSMEYSGDYGRFSATLKLRPGRLVLSVFPMLISLFSSRK